MRATALRRQRGFSLVELMISLAIGLVVMGAVYTGYMAASQSNRHSRAIAQMNEDAMSATAVLRANTAMAGFSVPKGAMVVNGRQMFDPTLPGPYLAGCDGGVFNDLAASMPSLACPSSQAGTSDSLAVSYQATAGNAATGSAGLLDCLGNAVGTRDGISEAYSIFYVDSNRLMCRGNPANAAQAMAENVMDMQIRYGVQTDIKRQVAYYADAQAVQTDNLWNRVASVRVCLVLRSDDHVTDEITPYTGCFPANHGDQITPADRRVYRAYTTTIVLNSLLPPEAPVAASGVAP